MIWGGLSPDLLAKISTYPDLCEAAARVLETMYCATLPREVHVTDLVNKELPHYYNSSSGFGERKRKRAGRAMLVLPDPLHERKNFTEFTNMCVRQTGIHTHCFTCMKGPKGCIGCRLCKPSGDTPATMPVELVDTTPIENISRKKIKVEFEVREKISEEKDKDDRKDARDDDGSEVSVPDSRLIVWEMERPLLLPLPSASSPTEDGTETQTNNEWYINQLSEAMASTEPTEVDPGSTQKADFIEELAEDLRGMKDDDLAELYNSVSYTLKDRNGYVADYNVLLSALMGCNTNSMFLGSREQSKGALFYIGPYICKNLVEVVDAFDLLLEAQDYAKKYPSTADDANTKKRFVQYVMTRVLNKLNSLMEVSDTQAAAALLGMNAGICSDIFSAYDPSSYEEFVVTEKYVQDFSLDWDERSRTSEETSDVGSMDSFIEDDGEDDDGNGSDVSSLDGGGETDATDMDCESGQNECNIDNSENNQTRTTSLETAEADCPFESRLPRRSKYQSTPIFKVDGGRF